MATFLFSFNAIAPMLFTTLLGAVVRRRGHISDTNIAFLNTLCFRYLLAFHIFNSSLAIDYRTEFNPKMIVYCTGAIVGTMLVAWVLFALTVKNRERRCIWILSSFRSSNIVYALAMAISLFGAEGSKAAAMLVPVTIICFNFFSVVLMVYHSQSGVALSRSLLRTAIDTARNPLIIGSVLGIVCSLLRVQFPGFLRSAVNSVAATATPMSFILLGAQINLSKLRQNLAPTLGASLMRLVLVPGILVPIMVAGGFRGPELGALMVVFAAPCAINTLIMAREYRIDPDFAAETVYLSTVLSMPTMFAFITVLRVLGLI
jgi:predicted permease